MAINEKLRKGARIAALVAATVLASAVCAEDGPELWDDDAVVKELQRRVRFNAWPNHVFEEQTVRLRLRCSSRLGSQGRAGGAHHQGACQRTLAEQGTRSETQNPITGCFARQACEGRAWAPPGASLTQCTSYGRVNMRLTLGGRKISVADERRCDRFSL